VIESIIGSRLLWYYQMTWSFISVPLLTLPRHLTEDPDYRLLMLKLTSTRDVEEKDQDKTTRTDGQSGDPGSTLTLLFSEVGVKKGS
jgi:hypothetical protein